MQIDPGAETLVEQTQPWLRPGIHLVKLAEREVWVRVDARGVCAMSSRGPHTLAATR
jgi:hypothetical protein